MATHSFLLTPPAIVPRRNVACDATLDRDAGRDVDHAVHTETDSDESLVRRAQGGEREALVIVYHRYVNEIYGYAYHQLGDAQDAEDVTSETFLRLVSALDSFDHRASFRTWLYVIARNQLRDRWRQRGRQPALAELDAADDGDPAVAYSVAVEADADAAAADDDTTGDSPWAERGRQVMAALPEHYRTVLTLRIGNGRSIRDVAEAMQTTPGNVKVLQHRALKRAAAVAAALEASGAPERAPVRR